MPPKKGDELEKEKAVENLQREERIASLERDMEEIKKQMKKKLSILDRFEKRMKEEDQLALETQKIQKGEIAMLDGEQAGSWVLWLEQYVELGDFSEVEKLQGVKLLEDFISEPISSEEDRGVVKEMGTSHTKAKTLVLAASENDNDEDKTNDFSEVLEGNLSHEEQFVDPKKTDVKMDETARQMFAKMILRRKTRKKKKKKRKWNKFPETSSRPHGQSWQWWIKKKTVMITWLKHETSQNKGGMRRYDEIQFFPSFKYPGLQSKIHFKSKKKLDVDFEGELSGIDNTVKDKIGQQGEEEQSDNDMAKDACQLFDNMLMGDKKKPIKRKQQKFAQPKKFNYKRGKQSLNALQIQKEVKSKYQNSRRLLAECLVLNTNQAFNKKVRWRFAKEKKRTRLKCEGNVCAQAAASSTRKRKRPQRTHIKFGKKKKTKEVMHNKCLQLYNTWLLRVINTRGTARTKMESERKNSKYIEYVHLLEYAKLSRNYKAAKKPRAKRKKYKRQQRHKPNKKRLIASRNIVSRKEIVERALKIQRMMGRMKGSKGVKCCYIMFDELLLWELWVKKKKPPIQNKIDYRQLLGYVLIRKTKKTTRKKTKVVVNNDDVNLFLVKLFLQRDTWKREQAYAHVCSWERVIQRGKVTEKAPHLVAAKTKILSSESRTLIGTEEQKKRFYSDEIVYKLESAIEMMRGKLEKVRILEHTLKNQEESIGQLYVDLKAAKKVASCANSLATGLKNEVAKSEKQVEESKLKTSAFDSAIKQLEEKGHALQSFFSRSSP